MKSTGILIEFVNNIDTENGRTQKKNLYVMLTAAALCLIHYIFLLCPSLELGFVHSQRSLLKQIEQKQQQQQR